MAKRKKKSADIGVQANAPSGNSSIDTGIESCENGFVVRISGSDGDGGYRSKRFIATSEPKALRLAHQGMQGLMTKGGKKKGGKKASARKRI